MSRLTCKYDGMNVVKETIVRGHCTNCEEYCNIIDVLGGDCDKCAIQKAFDKLAEYEDLEEQGLLLKLPCKLGSTVYYIDKKIYKQYYIEEMGVEDITFRDNEFYISLYNLTTECFDFCITSDDIGKTVFLTKEEAEKELERLNEQRK